MFRKSKIKIVAAIMTLLILVLGGTFATIYVASYVEVTNENWTILNQYVENYSLPSSLSQLDDRNETQSWYNNTPMVQLSTFYTVVFTKDSQLLYVDTADIYTYNIDELVNLAQDVWDKGKSYGTYHNLLYRIADKGNYILIAFLDNTVVLNSAGTLVNYTLIFGAVTLVILFFIARYLASRIVQPLEESYQKQRQFISDAGHELKTPVAVVNANVELLSRQLKDNQWLDNIQYENERMSALITQLLDLARTENVTPPMEELDFSHLVTGEMLPFETIAYEQGLRLVSEITPDLCVHGNSVQLKQLVSILIDNAISHSDNGKQVSVVLKKVKNHAILSVINDGAPIPEEERKQLFERFYRTDDARSDHGQHYGLGLAIAKAIVETHKGSIQVVCDQGKVSFITRLTIHKK